MEAIRKFFTRTRPTPAEPPTDTTVEPPPCGLQFSAEADGLHYCWWGGSNERSNSLSVYECSIEQWSFKPTTGPAHPGLLGGCSVCVGRCLYTFGGEDESTYINNLSKLDLDTLLWSKVQTTGRKPIRKSGCGLVRVNERTLCCIGGHGIGPTQPGSTFTRDTEESDGTGFTNEIHLFDVQDGSWSVPQFRGEIPPPCTFFTFTKVDQYRAVLFGGLIAEGPTGNAYYLINFRSMEVTKVEPVEGEPWPVGRAGHAACCLGYGENHPQLLVHGGSNNNLTALKDMWILDVDTGKWTEVTPPESMESRCFHSTTATSLGPGLTEVLMFGGQQAWQEAIIAETTILRFECTAPSASTGSGRWCLVDVAHNNTRASSQRLTDKIRMIQARARSSDHYSPDRRVRALQEHLVAAEHRERDTQQRCDRLLLEKDQEANRRCAEAQHSIQDAHRRKLVKDQELAVELAAKDQELAVKDQELAAKDQELTVARDDAERRVQELTGTNQQLQEDLRRSDRRAQLAEEQADDLETQWVVGRNEILLTERELGGGGWGEVKVAKFRGIEVAAKMLYTAIQSDYYRLLFIREMNMAARLRHPQLVQFIGATLEGEMIILTELMATSLRRVLERGRISREHILSISVQVCQALNYLHLMQPNPVIHRDISSANVLLNPLPNDSWIAKVTDYGSVNTQQLLNTANPSSPVYAAPEAQTPSLQSTKMDIFSLGVLLIEMCAGQFPSDDKSERLLLTIQDRTFSDIISRCIARERDNRPTAGQLLTQLH